MVFDGNCNCGDNCIGETGWDDLCDTSEPAKHLCQFPEHKCNWKTFRGVPNNITQRKIHETYYVHVYALP